MKRIAFWALLVIVGIAAIPALVIMSLYKLVGVDDFFAERLEAWRP